MPESPGLLFVYIDLIDCKLDFTLTKESVTRTLNETINKYNRRDEKGNNIWKGVYRT